MERDQARYRETQAELDALEALRRDFDARLASLSGPEGAERMRRATEQPLRLGGAIRAGESDEEA